MDAITLNATAANEGNRHRHDGHNSKEHHRKDISIVAKLLVLSVAEVITCTKEPCSHASDTLLILKSIGTQTWLAATALHLVRLV